MGRVRVCVESDVPRIAQLHRQVWTGEGDRASAYSGAYFAEMLFGNPWPDHDLPSLVYEDDRGEIVGCLGVMPRRMSIRGRPLRMAISHNFMVAPGSRSSLAGVQLMRTFFAGSQDLSIAEANDLSRRVWEGLGGSTAPIYEMVWTRPLRPGPYLASFLRNRRPDRRDPVWLRPVVVILEAIAAAMLAKPFRPPAPEGTSEELTTQSFLEFFAELAAGRTLRPEYDEKSLRWIFDLLDRKTTRGVLRKLLVRNKDHKVLGWYLYYAKAGGISDVVQIGARPTAIGEVLDHCFYDAWRQGAIALSGQMDPQLKRELSAKSCLFRDSGNSMLIKTHDPELMQALCRGDAFLTRLEGEWWIIP